MKKIVAWLLALLLISAVPLALAEEIDLSRLSFAELAALRDRAQMEMMARDEWQEVIVPAGLWEVGVDIPAGSWVVKCADQWREGIGMHRCAISWGRGKPYDEGLGLWLNGGKGDVTLYNPNHKFYTGGTAEIVVTVTKGDYIYIDPDYNQAVFAPYTGKPNLGFK